MSNLDKQIRFLESKSEEDLMLVIGDYAKGLEAPDALDEVVFQGNWSVSRLREYGRDFLKKYEPVIKEAVCGNDGILDNLDSATVKDLVVVLLPAFGIAAGAAIPTALVAVAVIIVRAGMREYCKGQGEAAAD